MTEYRNRTTGDVLTEREVKAEAKAQGLLLPKVWKPATLDSLDIDPVLLSPRPTPSTNLKRVRRDGIEQNGNGNWVQAWLEEDMFSGPTQAADEAAYLAQLAAAQAEADRINDLDDAVNTDTTLNTFKAMTNAEFNTWWSANVTTSAQAINVLKRLARLIIRRVL